MSRRWPRKQYRFRREREQPRRGKPTRDSPLCSYQSEMAGKPDPKPERRKRKQIRVVDRKATTRAVLGQPKCALCPSPSATGHHVIPRGGPHFGDDVPENIVALCGSGTTGCHGKIEGADFWAREALGVHLRERRPDTIEYVIRKLGGPQKPDAGLVWLERHLHVRVSP